MRISFSPTNRSVEAQRQALDAMSSVQVRVWANEFCENAPGEIFDAVIRYPDYGSENVVFVRRWDRTTSQATSVDFPVLVDRIHVY